MRLTKALFFAIAAALTAVFVPTGARAQDATALLRESLAVPAHLSYEGQAQSLTFGTSKSEATIYRVEHRAPNLTRRLYIAPQSLYGDWIVSRGSLSYNVDVKHHRLIVSHNAIIDDQVALDDNFGLLMANYRAVAGPADTIAGRACTGVLLMNKYTGRLTMRLWIDKATRLVLERERYAANGSVIHQFRFDQIRYTNDIPSAIFAQPNMSGYQVTRGMDHGLLSNDLRRVVQTAGFQARGPRYLPEGFLPIAGDVSDIKGVRTLHLLYSDGIRTVSLFQNNRGAAVDLSRYHPQVVQLEDHRAQYVEDGPTKLLAWDEENLHFALVGDLSRTELTRIAASVVP